MLDTSENSPFWGFAYEFLGRFEDDYLMGNASVREAFLYDATSGKWDA